MSVYKSRRQDASVIFIAAARDLRIITIHYIKKFPKSYRWMITNNMLSLATQIYNNTIKANSIYVHKNMSEEDYKLRHRYLNLAEADTKALLCEITFCYELVNEGNNFLGTKSNCDSIFQKWTNIGNIALSKIKAVKNSDKKRWVEFQKLK